ncbi:hypothetical protein [Candidatus Chlorohelix sp.]|uniref:hypothetical protein n=1 Tax=Candidatus Chlorohelix sp. TaxID=3139201 RepID=UPI003047ED9C
MLANFIFVFSPLAVIAAALVAPTALVEVAPPIVDAESPHATRSKPDISKIKISKGLTRLFFPRRFLKFSKV